MKPGDLVRLKHRTPAARYVAVATLWKSSATSGETFAETGEMVPPEVGIVLGVIEANPLNTPEAEVLTSSGQRGWTWMFLLEEVGE